MKVKELIRELRKMPQDMEVGIAAHDNSEGEVAGWVSSVWEQDVIDFETEKKTGKIAVVLQCQMPDKQQKNNEVKKYDKILSKMFKGNTG